MPIVRKLIKRFNKWRSGIERGKAECHPWNWEAESQPQPPFLFVAFALTHPCGDPFRGERASSSGAEGMALPAVGCRNDFRCKNLSAYMAPSDPWGHVCAGNRLDPILNIFGDCACDTITFC
jgi:hypothetical protein